MEFHKSAYQLRVEKILKKAEESEADALVIRKPANLRYVSGVRSHVDPELALIMGKAGEPVLLVPGYELDRVKQETWIKNVVSYSHTSEPPFLEDKIRESIDQMAASNGKIGIEEDFISIEEQRKLRSRLPEAEFLPASHLLDEMRMIKTPDEISLLREAAELVDKGIEAAGDTLREGVTEIEIAAAAEYAMRINGSEGLPFPTLIASGAKTFNAHAYPSDKKVSKGELVILDMGSNYKGYLSDITRVACVGKSTERQRSLFEIVYKAMEFAVETIKPGVKSSEVDEAARKLVEGFGYEEHYLYPTGRGIGLEIHEKPWCRRGDDTIIRDGMVLGLFPGIYLKGEGGIRLEDVILVTKRGAEFLTEYERDLIIR